MSNIQKVIAASAVLLVVAAAWGLFQNGTEFQSSPQEKAGKSPAPGKVVMLDLGAEKCIPCKMMAPILEELKKDYDGRAEIIFVDVWQDSEQAQKYGIRAIPTQIFFNEKGQEVGRHIGFMDKKTIIKKLAELGVDPPEKYRDS